MISLILDGLLEALARLESRNLPGIYLHPLSGLRVLTFPSLLLPDVELPEARQLDFLAPLERLCYARRESFQVFSGFVLWRVGVLDHLLYQLLFVHGCFPPCLIMLTSLSPTLGSRVRKHGRHRGSFVESRPSSTSLRCEIGRSCRIPMRKRTHRTGANHHDSRSLRSHKPLRASAQT